MNSLCFVTIISGLDRGRSWQQTCLLSQGMRETVPFDTAQVDKGPSESTRLFALHATVSVALVCPQSL